MVMVGETTEGSAIMAQAALVLAVRRARGSAVLARKA